MSVDIDQRRAEAELRRDLDAGDRQAKRSARAETRRDRHDRKADRRQRRRDRRSERAAGLAALGRKLRPATPIALVTALAMFGQVDFAYQELVLPGWTWLLRLALALGVGIAYESISLTVQWHAHDSLMRGHTLTAARQRKASYLIALVGAGVNYSHYARPDWGPTTAAVCFATFSAASPLLWGLHTRRVHQVQLSREGRLDVGGAVFSAERYRWFPWRTLGAVRWSIDRYETDPRAAWTAYNAEREGRRAERRQGPGWCWRLAGVLARSAPGGTGELAGPETRDQMIARLIDVEGYGRLRLAAALGIKTSEARALIDARRQQLVEPGDDDQAATR